MNIKSRMLLLLCKEIERKGVLLRLVHLEDPVARRNEIIPEKEKLTCIYLAFLIIELSYGRFCFLSIRFDCRGTRGGYFREMEHSRCNLSWEFRVFANDVSPANEFDTSTYLRECNHERA